MYFKVVLLMKKKLMTPETRPYAKKSVDRLTMFVNGM